MISNLLTVSVFLLISSLYPFSAKADGDEHSYQPDPATRSEATPEATPNQASDASFDKRLPPVLPGEIMNDTGRTLKVWSTAGPVPVSRAPDAPAAAQAPEPFNATNALKPGSINVIIDDRARPKKHGRSQHRNSDTDALNNTSQQHSETEIETNFGDSDSLGKAMRDAGLE